MSGYFPNPEVERRTIETFICTLYANVQKDSLIESEGMYPLDIWKKMKLKAYLEPIIPSILKTLVNNGIKQGFLRFDKATGRVMITPQGRQMCEDINYRRIPGVFD